MTDNGLLDPTVERIRMECARHRVAFSDMWRWGRDHGLEMNYTLLTAYMREDRPVSIRGMAKLVQLFNGVLVQRSKAPLFKTPEEAPYEVR